MPSLSDTESYYSVLQINQNATGQEIKKSYKRLAILRHPDKNIGDFNNASTAFKKLQTAYSILSNPLSRAKYDKKLEQPVSYRDTKARKSPRSDFSDDKTTSAPSSSRRPQKKSNFKPPGATYRRSRSSPAYHNSDDDSDYKQQRYKPRPDFSDGETTSAPSSHLRPKSSNFKPSGANYRRSGSSPAYYNSDDDSDYEQQRYKPRSNFSDDETTSAPRSQRRPKSSNFKPSGANYRRSGSSPAYYNSDDDSDYRQQRYKPRSDFSDDETTSAPKSPRRPKTSNFKPSGANYRRSGSSSVYYDSDDDSDHKQQRDKDDKEKEWREGAWLDEAIRESMRKVEGYLKEMKLLMADDDYPHDEWVDINVRVKAQMRLQDRMKRNRDAWYG